MSQGGTVSIRIPKDVYEAIRRQQKPRETYGAALRRLLEVRK